MHRPEQRYTAICALCLCGCFRAGYELLERSEPASSGATGVDVPGAPLLQEDGGVLLSQPTIPDAGAADAGSAAPDASPPPADCGWGEPELLVVAGVSGAQLFGGPHLSPDALTLYFSLQLGGSSEDIYVATRSSTAGDFGGAVRIDEVSSPAADGSPFVTADDASLYFFSQRGGSQPTARDLYVSTRSTPGGAFGPPSVVPGINSTQLDQAPHLSTDGLELWLGSHRGNTGFEDLYVARRARTSDDFDAPTAVDQLNSSGRDTGAALSADGLSVYYSSERSGTQGGFDLWLARRASRTAAFSTIEPLSELNGRDDEFDPTLSGDERQLVFVSNRGGSTRLWQATRQCE
jgi:hypothetical protein